MCCTVPGMAPAHPVADMTGMSGMTASPGCGDMGAVPCDLQQQTMLPTNAPVAALTGSSAHEGGHLTALPAAAGEIPALLCLQSNTVPHPITAPPIPLFQLHRILLC